MKRKSEDTKKVKVSWTPEEDEALLKAVQEDQIPVHRSGNRRRILQGHRRGAGIVSNVIASEAKQSIFG